MIHKIETWRYGSFHQSKSYYLISFVSSITSTFKYTDVRAFVQLYGDCFVLKKRCLSRLEYLKTKRSFIYVASWSSGRYSALGPKGPEFETWFHQVDVEPSGKDLYMYFITTLRCKMSTPLKAVKDLVGMLD